MFIQVKLPFVRINAYFLNLINNDLSNRPYVLSLTFQMP